MRCVRPQFQWYQVTYATEIKSIQLNDSIVGLSLKDSILYIYANKTLKNSQTLKTETTLTHSNTRNFFTQQITQLTSASYFAYSPMCNIVELNKNLTPVGSVNQREVVDAVVRMETKGDDVYVTEAHISEWLSCCRKQRDKSSVILSHSPLNKSKSTSGRKQLYEWSG